MPGPNPFEWFLIGCNIISVPIYLLFLVTVFRNRSKEPFNSSFFALTFSLGVVAVPQMIRRYFNRSVTWGLGHIYVRYLPMWLVYLLFNLDQIFLWYNQQAENISAMWLAINRLTALALPTQYDKIWSRRTTIIAIVLQFLLSAFFVSPMFFNGWPYFVDINNKTGVVAETPYDQKLPNLMSEIAGYLIEFIIVVCGICYALSIRSVWKFRHQAIQTTARRVSATREAHFSFVSLVTFLLLCLYYVRMEALSNGWSNIYYQIGTYAGDIRSFITPYMMYLVSKNVRDALRYQLAIFIPPLRPKNSSNTTVNVQINAVINNALLTSNLRPRKEYTSSTNLANDINLQSNMAFNDSSASPKSLSAHAALNVVDLE